MERTCFAFKETKHNHCECLILNNLECKNRDCRFFKVKNEVDFQNIEKEIIRYAKKKN